MQYHLTNSTYITDLGRERVIGSFIAAKIGQKGITKIHQPFKALCLPGRKYSVICPVGVKCTRRSNLSILCLKNSLTSESSFTTKTQKDMIITLSQKKPKKLNL